MWLNQWRSNIHGDEVWVLLTGSLHSSLGGRSLVFPEQTSTSFVELTPAKSLSLNAFTLCLRFATELFKERREVILFHYRTQDTDELTLWRLNDGRYELQGLQMLPEKLRRPWNHCEINALDSCGINLKIPNTRGNVESFEWNVFRENIDLW